MGNSSAKALKISSPSGHTASNPATGTKAVGELLVSVAIDRRHGLPGNPVGVLVVLSSR
jgi:hypothetical protein